MFFRTWRCLFFTLDYCYKNNSAIFHKNFSIFFYFFTNTQELLQNKSNDFSMFSCSFRDLFLISVERDCLTTVVLQ